MNATTIVPTSQETAQGSGLIVMQDDGTVLSHNQFAKGLIQHKDALLVKDGRLRLRKEAAAKAFESELRELVDPATARTEAAIGIPTTAGRGYVLRMSVLDAADFGSPTATATVLIQIDALQPDRPRAPVFSSQSDMMNGSPSTAGADATTREATVQIEPLRTRYELTPAESRVCEAMFRLGTLERARGEFGITRNTIKSHLRNVFSKMNVSTQGELMKTLALSVNATVPANRLHADWRVSA